MSIKNLLLAAGTVSLVAAPLAAASADVSRASQPAAEASGLDGSSSVGTNIILGALLVAGLAFVFIVDDDDDPVSP